MYCEKCGKNNPEGATFCEECGAELTAVENNVENEAQNVAEPEYEAPVQNVTEDQDKIKKIITVVIAAVAVIIVLFGASKLFGCSGVETPIKNQVKALNNEKATTMIKSFPKAMQKEIKDDEDKMESLEDMLKSVKDNYEDEYGKNVKVSVKVLDKHKWDKEELEDEEEYIEEVMEEYDDNAKLQAAYDVAVKLTFKGSKKKEVEYDSMTVYKINGKWCILGY